MTTEGLCRRCKMTGGNLLYRGQDFLSNEPFVVLTCDNCRVARTGPDDYDSDPDRYYPSTYYGDDGQRFLGPLEKLVSLFRRARVREITRHSPKPGRVLDMGCGRGWMLNELHQLGWTTIGVERSLSAVVARAKSGVEFLEASSLQDCKLAADSFQAITLWHSLEHLEEPWVTLDEANRLLAPGGIAIVEVPNLASLQARLTKSVWFHLDAPRHRVHLTMQQLVEDLETRGFEVLERRTLSLEYGPYGMLQSLLNLMMRRNNLLYQILRRQSPPDLETSELLGTALMLPLALAVSIPLEFVAAAFGRGGIAHVVARKPLLGSKA